MSIQARTSGLQLVVDESLRGTLALGLLEAEGASNQALPPAFDEERDRLVSRLASHYAGKQPADIPGVSETRALFHRLDIDPTKTRPSSEALLRRVLQGKGLPRVAPVVDVCNLCSLEHQLPLGLYDRNLVRGAVRVRVGRESEGYAGIRKQWVNLTGRLLLADDDGPFGAPTSDSRRTSVSAETRNLLVVIFSPPERAATQLSAGLEHIADLLTRHCGATVVAVRVLQSAPSTPKSRPSGPHATLNFPRPRPTFAALSRGLSCMVDLQVGGALVSPRPLEPEADEPPGSWTARRSGRISSDGITDRDGGAMNRFFSRAVVVALIAAGSAMPAAAQLNDNLGALSGENAKGYLGPLPKALSGTLNSAIFNTGDVPKAKPNFTVGVRLMGVTFSDDDRTYRPTDPPGFTGTGPVDAPTIIGNTQAVLQSGQGGTSLYHPGGFDIGEFAVAVPELTVGSVMGTRAVVRWISLDLGDSDFGKFSLFGIGAQHSISQYLPGLPVDLAFGAFYQTFNIDDDLIDTQALNVNVTGSKSFGPFQPFVGVGFDNFEMNSEYEDSNSPGEKISVDFDTESNMHLTIGGLLNLPVVKIQGEFNVAAQTGAAIGLSFGL